MCVCAMGMKVCKVYVYSCDVDVCMMSINVYNMCMCVCDGYEGVKGVCEPWHECVGRRQLPRGSFLLHHSSKAGI